LPNVYSVDNTVVEMNWTMGRQAEQRLTSFDKLCRAIDPHNHDRGRRGTPSLRPFSLYQGHPPKKTALFLGLSQACSLDGNSSCAAPKGLQLPFREFRDTEPAISSASILNGVRANRGAREGEPSDPGAKVRHSPAHSRHIRSGSRSAGWTLLGELPTLPNDLLNSADLTSFQADLDAVWVVGRARQDVFYDPAGPFPSALVRFQDDVHYQTGPNVFSILTVQAADSRRMADTAAHSASTSCPLPRCEVECWLCSSVSAFLGRGDPG